jgi:hypothetical protein
LFREKQDGYDGGQDDPKNAVESHPYSFSCVLYCPKIIAYRPISHNIYKLCSVWHFC